MRDFRLRLGTLPIRWRLALWYALFLVATVVGTSVVVLSLLGAFLQDQIDDALRLRAARVDLEITTGTDALLNPEDVATSLLDLAPLEEFAAPGVYVQIIDHQGNVIGTSANIQAGGLPVTPEMLAIALSSRESFSTVQSGGQQVRVLSWPITSDQRIVGVAVVGQSLRFLDATLNTVRQLTALGLLIGLATAVTGGWWLTSRALDPVVHMIRVAREIGAARRFEQRIEPPPTTDELGELATTLNAMLDRIDQVVRRQHEFLADASHELRAPLTVIRGNLDLLTLDIDAEDRAEIVREAREEVDRMSCMAEDLLFLAEVDGVDATSQEPIMLSDVVAAAWERALDLDEGAHRMTWEQDAAATVRGDAERLYQMVLNLLLNALRYTPPGGSVQTAVRLANGDAVIIVHDTGVGIPAEHLPHIFERFYRVDRSRSRQHDSHGLGLAIVQRIVEAHGGTVAVESTLGVGSTFTVMLPRVHDASPTDIDALASTAW